MVRVMPAGEFSAPRGAFKGSGPWRLTPEAAASIIAINRSRSADILVDFEHQALLTESNGKPVPAAGWVDPRSLEWRGEGDEPGLYGAVTWVGDVPEMIEADRYRYLSPVFPYDTDGAPLDLLHIALTNFPGIDEPLYAALSARYRVHASGGAAASAHPHQEDSQMELLKKLLVALGLPEATSEADALAGVAALKTKADGAQAELAALKTQVDGATAEVAALKAGGGTPDPAKYVPIATFQAERDERLRLAALSGQSEVKGLVEAAIADGRLLEAQRAYAEDLGQVDLAALKGLIDSAAPLAALKGMQSQGREPGARQDAASDAQLAVCKALGLSADEFNKAKLGA
ncbi:phage protease [Thauera mechernichensis]|uniref:Phage protease n=1 Tax=Thauera mechernichensis TaxID=82788 RepID=A0ABW3WG72_9RHOO|nr:phage protease [Thauera mechernichensis]MDG3063260.1 phage protease [Thauera mechernichensis]